MTIPDKSSPATADKTVTLRYKPRQNQINAEHGDTRSEFSADPTSNPIFVRRGQTIHFDAPALPAGGKIQLTFPDKHLFSTRRQDFSVTGIFEPGDGLVTVVGDLAPGTKTTYHCKLFVAGELVGESHEGGGDIMPAGD